MSGGNATRTDDGYFPRGSMLRTVHEERLVGLFYGQRALCIGALMPLNFVGTMAHTRWHDRMFQRLSHTGMAFEAVMFGSRAEADNVLAMIAKMHQRVQGELPVDAGATKAGTPYSAMDPDLMLWTVAVIADSAQRFYELFVRRLSDDERERLWQDYLRFGELFGMPAAQCPQTYAEFRQWWHTRLYSEQMHLTPEARYIGHATAFRIPLPAAHAPFMLLQNTVQLGALPAIVRRHYRLHFGPADQAAYIAAVAALRSGRLLAPAPLRRGSSQHLYRLVATTEADRIAHGRPTPQMADVAA
jgi:uncharacterized protein (DUF2236 family)